ncbi:MAG: Abi family protein [Chitinophagales bacterium]
MRYTDFAGIMAEARMERYRFACNGNPQKAMVLFRKNLKLSRELFTVISCFEIALRNSIDTHYTKTLGNHWLRNAAVPGSVFDNRHCRLTQININDAIRKLDLAYTHYKLVAELGFGFWRYLFAHQQFRACGSTLLKILPAKPRTTAAFQYNHTFVFNRLRSINDLRNRIAHHEPICFLPGQPVKDTIYARRHYNHILQLFQWMNIDESALLYGLDHIVNVCNEVDAL